jgi:hypothetical protein
MIAKYNLPDIFASNADRSTNPHDIELAALDHPTDGSRREAKDRRRFTDRHQREERSRTRLRGDR